MKNGNYGITTLYNGIKVVTEKVDTVDAVSIGIYVETGSRHEKDNERGISHMVEHMMFKGTKTRSSIDIFRTFENIGADLNAYTDKDHTSYYCKATSEHFPLMMEVLSDMLLNSVFDPEELEKERNVIIEEYYMRQDIPNVRIFEYAEESVFGDNTVGKPIIGTVDTIKSITRDMLIDYVKRQYTGSNMIVSIAGNIDHDYAVKVVGQYLSGIPQGLPNDYEKLDPRKLTRGNRSMYVDDTAQSQIVISIGGLSDIDVYENATLFNILCKYIAGGMSSRLTRLIREENGLAYSVGCMGSTFIDGGAIFVYIGTQHQNVETVINMAVSDLEDIRENGISKEDFDNAFNMYKGDLILHTETIDARMARNAKRTMDRKDLITVNDLIKEFEGTDEDDLYEWVREMLYKEDFDIYVMGPEEARPSWF